MSIRCTWTYWVCCAVSGWLYIYMRLTYHFQCRRFVRSFANVIRTEIEEEKFFVQLKSSTNSLQFTLTYSRHLINSIASKTPRNSTPTHDEIIITIHESSIPVNDKSLVVQSWAWFLDAKNFPFFCIPFLGDSMNSIFVLSRCPVDGWQMNAAKHGCDSLPDIATIAVNRWKEKRNETFFYQNEHKIHRWLNTSCKLFMIDILWSNLSMPSVV